MSVPGSTSDSSTIVVVPSRNIANVPYVGQMFDSDELAYEFYNVYAGQCAFGVRKGYVHKLKKTGRIIDRKYYCDKEGKKKHDPRRMGVKIPRKDTRCGCGAEMSIYFDAGLGKYVVKTFVEVHNHLLQPIDCAHMIRSQRKFKVSQAFSAENAISSGLSLKETFEYMGNEVGGVENLGFMKDDLKRHLQTKRQRSMEYGEAGVILDYFQKQRALNPSFYSAYLLDEEQQITNIFWADPSMILDYASFGDVLAFDTTYKTNNCHRPCAVFAGFSNNRKTLIFGGALLYDETSASFAWLFKEFLQCMSNKKPKTIFTDQAQAIANGLKAIMPETKHCLCTWHLTMNLRKHYGRFLGGGEDGGILKGWYHCMNVSTSPEQFDKEWEKFVDQWGVGDEAWFKSKYDLREKWATAFLHETLTLGMSTTQLSESLNALLKQWLKSSIDILTFFDRFDKVVNKKRYEERKMVYESRLKFHSDRIKLSPMLHHASQKYTLHIFDKFHIEFDEASGLVILEETQYIGGILYRVARYGELNNQFEVCACKERELVQCSCSRFEMFGYLCCHALKILDHMNIKTIPLKYILKRWTKEARGDCVLDFKGLKITVEPHLRISQRYHSITPSLVKMGSMAALCNEGTDYLVEALKPIAAELSRICLNNATDPDIERGSLSGDHDSTGGSFDAGSIQAKGLAKNKGKKSDKREKGWYELYTGKKRTKSIIGSNLPSSTANVNEVSAIHVRPQFAIPTIQAGEHVIGLDEFESDYPTAPHSSMLGTNDEVNLEGSSSRAQQTFIHNISGSENIDILTTPITTYTSLLNAINNDSQRL